MTEALFRPFRVRSLDLPNRIVMAPMTRAAAPDGVPGPANAAYYARRAAGGAGLIVTEGTTIDRPGAWNHTAYPHVHGDAALAGWRTVVQAVHGAGGRIACQLWHVGGYRNPRMPDCNAENLESPSGDVGRAMSEADIADTIAAFGRGAANARAVGFDAVEIHGAHGYLIDQFLWGPTNRRTDRWGRDRALFATEVVRAVRAAVGPDYPVGFRWSDWKQQDYDARLAETPDGLAALLGPLRDAGVDIFHCSQRRYWEPAFPGSELNLAGWAKKLTGAATVTVGAIGLDIDLQATLKGGKPGLRPLQPLLDRLARDEFDLVALGRTMIANAGWAEAVRAGRTGDLVAFDPAMLARLD